LLPSIATDGDAGTQLHSTNFNNAMPRVPCGKEKREKEDGMEFVLIGG